MPHMNIFIHLPESDSLYRGLHNVKQVNIEINMMID